MTAFGAERKDVPIAEDIAVIVRRMGVVGSGQRILITPLAGGVSSRIVLVEAQETRCCVKQALAKLDVATDWYAPVTRSRAEIAWLRTANTILPGIAPKVLAEDRPSESFAMEYLDLATHPLWKAELLAGRAQMGVPIAVGTAIGRLHAATAGRAHIERAFENAEDFQVLRIEPYLLAAAAKHPDLAVILRSLATETTNCRIALVHGDVSPKNILIGGACGVVFLDAETATYGDPAFDAAFCLTHLLLKAVVLPQSLSIRNNAAAFLTAYLQELTWESPHRLENRLIQLLPALLLARIDGKSPVDYLGERRRSHVRSFARTALLAPFPTIEMLFSAWMEALAHL